jgi:HPt (histidine-containing phosphotransfer) domain-containing protein
LKPGLQIYSWATNHALKVDGIDRSVETLDCQTQEASVTLTSPMISQNDLTVRPESDLQDLIPDFMNNRRNDLAQIEVALNNKDFLFIKRLGHTLKGIARPYGFVYLETLSKKLETAGETQDMNQLQAIYDEIKFYLENVRIIYEPS